MSLNFRPKFTLINFLIFIALLVVLSIFLSQKATAPTSKNSQSKTTTFSKGTVKLNTLWANGTLKYSGSVTFPTPCHTLVSSAKVLESHPEQVRIDLIADADESPPSTVCAQVITAKDFSGEVKVSKDATVSVYLDGELVQ